MKETMVAKELLNAVYESDYEGVIQAIQKGANPSWIFNGYPILLHAVYLQDKDMMMLLIQSGALQTQEALGFALEHALGNMVLPLTYLGIKPKAVMSKSHFGDLPARFAPTSIAHHYA